MLTFLGPPFRAFASIFDIMVQKRMSVTHITKPVGFTPQGEPIRGGLEDPELGDTDTRGENGRVNDHPGYFGHVEVRF